MRSRAADPALRDRIFFGPCYPRPPRSSRPRPNIFLAPESGQPWVAPFGLVLVFPIDAAPPTRGPRLHRNGERRVARHSFHSRLCRRVDGRLGSGDRAKPRPAAGAGDALQGGGDHAAAGDDRCELRGHAQAARRSRPAQGSRRHGAPGGRARVLLGARKSQRRRQAQIRLRQSVGGTRPRQQGGRRLGHFDRLCRGSGRLALARAQGRDMRTGRSGLRRQGIRRPYQDDEQRRDGMGLSGVGRARGARDAAAERAR